MGEYIMNGIPPPPPGFTDDVSPSMPSASATIPPPPPGFTDDVSDNQPSTGTSNWSLMQKAKLAGSIFGQVSQQTPWAKAQQGLKDVAGWGAEKMGAAGVNPKVSAALMTPVAMFPELLAGYTALPESAQTGITEGASALFGRAKQAAQSEAGAIFPTGGGTEPPVPPGGAGATPPTPPANPETAQPLFQKPNYLQQTGGAGLNAQTGIRGSTILKMTPKGQNPGTIGINLAKELQDAGVSATNPIDAFDSMQKLTQNAGQAVGSAKQAIAEEASKYGQVGNPLELDANSALQPLRDAWQSHAKNITGVGKDVADYLGSVHDKLSEFAQAQGGTLNLDNIDQALSEVGPLTHKGSDANQLMNQELYHALADTRDSMVQQVASQAKNPALSSSLLAANQQYSKFIRLLPDVAKASANSAVGQKNLMQLWGDLQNTIINRTGLAVGSHIPTGSQALTTGQLASKAVKLWKPGQQQ